MLTGAATTSESVSGPPLRLPLGKRREVEDQAAADEIGAYVQRLSAQDWSIPAIEFDYEFESLYAAFQEWRGLTQDHKQPASVLELASGEVSEVEWNRAVDKGKNEKASSVDGLQNEHMKTLDLKNRREYLSPAFSDIYENGEIEEWKVRAVTFLDKTSTKDHRKLEEKRGVSLLSCGAKTFRQALAARLRVFLRAKLSDTQGGHQVEGTAHNVLILTRKVGERLEERKIWERKKLFDPPCAAALSCSLFRFRQAKV